MIDDLKNNLDVEIEIIREINKFSDNARSANPSEKRIYYGMINSLKKRIELINNSFPEILKEINLTKKLSPKNPEKIIENSKVSLVKKPDIDKLLWDVTLKGIDKKDYMKELNISENLIKKISKSPKGKKKKIENRERAGKFGKFSNKLFFETSYNLVKKEKLNSLRLNLRKSNLNILATTYISMMFLGVIISSIVSLFLLIFLLLFQMGITPPYISFYEGDYILRFAKMFWIVIAIPLITLFLFYSYPGAENKSLKGRINEELPFAVIHMASISGSGIQPLEIFRIIGMSDEYKYLGQEIRKILNQTNLYGYGLTNALRNVARATPSPKLAELLNGISITIHSGGDIKKFFEKRGQSLLLEYRLEREKYTKTTETFMDLYISIVIAAPMILLMLLIMISVSGMSIGFGVAEMSLAVVGVVAIINIIFLSFLHFKQPGY